MRWGSFDLAVIGVNDDTVKPKLRVSVQEHSEGWTVYPHKNGAKMITATGEYVSDPDNISGLGDVYAVLEAMEQLANADDVQAEELVLKDGKNNDVSKGKYYIMNVNYTEPVLIQGGPYLVEWWMEFVQKELS